MTLRHGQVVTEAFLEDLFSTAVINYNALDYLQIAAITSGQVLYKPNHPSNLGGDFLNVYSEQSYEMRGDMDILRHLREEVKELMERK